MPHRSSVLSRHLGQIATFEEGEDLDEVLVWGDAGEPWACVLEDPAREVGGDI